MRTTQAFLSLLLLCALPALAQPAEETITRCEVSAVPLGAGATDWRIERCAADVQENEIWQVDRSDSVSGELNGMAVRRTTGRGAVVYVVDTGILRRHDEFVRPDGNAVIGGFDALRASGGRSPCPDFALEPCYSIPGHRARHGHGTSVASVVAGSRTGIAPDAKLYVTAVSPLFPGFEELSMWHIALDEIIRHAWDPSSPQFNTAIVTCSVPVNPVPGDPLYIALDEKVRRMTTGVDANGNADPNGKKFLFTIAAGNLPAFAGFDPCGTFPGILGPEVDGIVTVGGITRENVYWSRSCSGATVEVVAPAGAPVTASISAVNHYRRGEEISGTSFAAPYVAGIAARLLEIDPTRTPAELEALLKASPSHADDSGLPVPVVTVGMESRP